MHSLRRFLFLPYPYFLFSYTNTTSHHSFVTIAFSLFFPRSLHSVLAGTNGVGTYTYITVPTVRIAAIVPGVRCFMSIVSDIRLHVINYWFSSYCTQTSVPFFYNTVLQLVIAASISPKGNPQYYLRQVLNWFVAWIRGLVKSGWLHKYGLMVNRKNKTGTTFGIAWFLEFILRDNKISCGSIYKYFTMPPWNRKIN